MILSSPAAGQPTTNGPLRTRPKKPPLWRRRRTLFIAMGLLLIVAVAVALTRSQSAPSAPPAQQTAAPLIAHGQIVPTHQARVGTQAGGVVQRLDAASGVAVNAP